VSCYLCLEPVTQGPLAGAFFATPERIPSQRAMDRLPNKRAKTIASNAVRKVLRSGETSFEYERNVQPRPKLGGWTGGARRAVVGQCGQADLEELTLIQLFEELRRRGHDWRLRWGAPNHFSAVGCRRRCSSVSTSPHCPLDSYNWRNVSAFIA
jgi:hypothetical protein